MCVHDVGQSLAGPSRREWGPSSYQHEEDDSKTPHINFRRVIGITEKDLWGRVLERTTRRLDHFPGKKRSGQAKVGELDSLHVPPPTRAEDEVLWFEVPVNHVQLVAVLDGGHGLSEDVPREVFLDAA